MTGPMPAMQAVTANRLADGRVVFLTEAGGWSTALAAARAVGEDGAAALLAAAEADAARALVVAPYLIRLDEGPDGPVAADFRERIRAEGPTIHLAFADACAPHRED